MEMRLLLFGYLLTCVRALLCPLNECPKMTEMESLDLDRFKGTWYQWGAAGNLFTYAQERCVTTKYILGKDRRNFTIESDRIIGKGIIQRHIKTTWSAMGGEPNWECPLGLPTGKLDLTVKHGACGDSNMDLLVLETDYSDFAILATCQVIKHRLMASWILTRKRKYTGDKLHELLEAIDAVLHKNQMQRSDYTITNQDNCEDVKDSKSLYPNYQAGFNFNFG